jgi:hypothetical protein
MKIAFLPQGLSRRLLAIGLVLVAGASIVAGREQTAPEALEARPARSEPAAATPEIDLAKLERREAAAPQGDPFAPRNFAAVKQATAPRAAASPEAPKGPPPLPFTYAGWMTQDGKTEIFIARGDELISIEVGQKIDAQYRVDSITEERIAFTYLPMKKRQSIERTETSG